MAVLKYRTNINILKMSTENRCHFGKKGLAEYYDCQNCLQPSYQCTVVIIATPFFWKLNIHFWGDTFSHLRLCFAFAFFYDTVLVIMLLHLSSGRHLAISNLRKCLNEGQSGKWESFC